MEQSNQTPIINKPIESLESEIKDFAERLPYWSKYIAQKILSGSSILDKDIALSYSYLLEEIKLIPAIQKPPITIVYNTGNTSGYKSDLLFTKLENIQGVNALAENQVLELGPNISIIYGSNGSGKSGYTRLLKKAFYSKSPEEIIKNIHLEKGHKAISASFRFSSGGNNIDLNYPADASREEFEQFSVFDGKSVINHIDAKNGFDFRPAGLNFFSSLIDYIKKIEERLNTDIRSRKSDNNFSDLFEGESEIKNLITNLSEKTKIESLKKYLPFSEQDKREKNRVEKEYDDILLASKGKEREIKKLENIKQLLLNSKENIVKLNKFFSAEALTKVNELIKDTITTEQIAKDEGVQNFNSELIKDIGSEEWREFIIAAQKFAQKQKFGESQYPQGADNCLLCHQPLSDQAQQLILKYWLFIKSEAEKKSIESQNKLKTAKNSFEKLDFILFPTEGILTSWLAEKNAPELEKLRESLSSQKNLSEIIVSDFNNKKITTKEAYQVSTSELETIATLIDQEIKILKENGHSEKLKSLLNEKTKLIHKEKLELHFPRIEAYVENQIWITKANKANWGKRGITEAEKNLSGKYFNQKYIDTFNKECSKLDGNFGIVINHTGSAGTSYRQLSLKGNTPSIILSEGEQKVIALSDFLSEMQLSEINKGIIFDDPVNSLDEKRKKQIAERISEESKFRQVVIFTHDLVFTAGLLTYCEDFQIPFVCHWIEKNQEVPGKIWLNNSPSHEKEYRNATIPLKHYSEAKKEDCPPTHREFLLKAGFAALRTCYEVLVINDLFKNVVQRYNERVSVDSLSSVVFDNNVVDELLDSFANCCRYMEGHTHSDSYAYQKPEVKNLNEEIQRYDAIRNKIKKLKKA